MLGVKKANETGDGKFISVVSVIVGIVGAALGTAFWTMMVLHRR
jgi:hypothetical protein